MLYLPTVNRDSSNVLTYMHLLTSVTPVLLCSLPTEGDALSLLTDCLKEIQRNQQLMLEQLSARGPQVLPWVSSQRMDSDQPTGSGLVNFLAPARVLSACTDEEVDFLWETSSGLEENHSSATSTPRHSHHSSDIIMVSPSPSPQLLSPPGRSPSTCTPPPPLLYSPEPPQQQRWASRSPSTPPPLHRLPPFATPPGRSPSTPPPLHRLPTSPDPSPQPQLQPRELFKVPLVSALHQGTYMYHSME